MCDLTAALLGVALHHDIREANADFGVQRLNALIGGERATAELADALSAAIAAGLIHDPVRLEDGALQCHWHLQLTAKGLAAARFLAE